jgi:hypothetical protein
MSTDLARRVMACKHWRWLPGMRDTDGRIYCGCGEWADMEEFAGLVLTAGSDDPLPDLTDALTRLGGLLALVREVWGRPMLVAYYAPLTTGQGWYVGDRFCGGRDYPIVEAPSATEEEALVAALEAALEAAP